jgi:hypothetical protein
VKTIELGGVSEDISPVSNRGSELLMFSRCELLLSESGS